MTQITFLTGSQFSCSLIPKRMSEKRRREKGGKNTLWLVEWVNTTLPAAGGAKRTWRSPRWSPGPPALQDARGPREEQAPSKQGRPAWNEALLRLALEFLRDEALDTWFHLILWARNWPEHLFPRTQRRGTSSSARDCACVRRVLGAAVIPTRDFFSIDTLPFYSVNTHLHFLLLLYLIAVIIINVTLFN